MKKTANPCDAKIRAAELRDASALAVLAGQLGYSSTREQVEARLRKMSGNPERVVLVAEFSDGTLAGYADLFLFHTVGADVRVEVGGLVVGEASRSHGIGAMLMARAEDWAREKGCSVIGLRSNVIRDGAHRFYENLGYCVNKTQKSFRKTL
ncbi:MAG TPA: GNAT family N-acetyltransferase [Candidatus Acidoferrales bacterium]|nr:GNAT family N-acetyltransferase [Candidatus Acidoferrales bacterium]